MAGRRSSHDGDRGFGIDEQSAFVSFIVRVWKPTQAEQHSCRGWVEEVQSGEKTSFLGLDELIDVFRRRIDAPPDSARSQRGRSRRRPSTAAPRGTDTEPKAGGEEE